jgi:hypothetical protein
MRKTLIVLLLGLAAGAAQAQIRCWTDKDGHRACGDTPPPGAKVREVQAPAPATAAPEGYVKKEQAFQKRQLEAQQAREKEDKAQAAAAAKRENCARARESQRAMQSGQRIARTNAQGERYYLSDAQVAAEAERAQKLVEELCK